LPHSKVKQSVAELLKQAGFITGVKTVDATVGKTLHLTLNDENANSPITEIVRMSKPGRRYYVRTQDIPSVKRGRGVVIISTSKGMMTGDEAKKQGIGGELICKIY
jgi:small subunit ribosomal protein S8